MEKDDKILNIGLNFDLNQTTLAYHLGGVDRHWVDYKVNDNDFDEKKYYADFDAWWSSLDEKEREDICNLICK